MLKQEVARGPGGAVLVMDSITLVEPADEGALVVSGSHGGTSSGTFALEVPLKLVVFNDAGVGKDEAGIAALPMLQARGVAGVAVAHGSARIGDAQDSWEHGVVSHLNDEARALGLAPGQPVKAALLRLVEAPGAEDAAARLLWSHWQAGSKLAELPAPMRPRTRRAGYATQARLPAVGGRQVVGWKIAATSAAGQAHINVSGPLAGRLLSGQVHGEGALLSLAGNGMRVVEPEFAFRFGRALPPRAARYEVAEVLAAVASLHPSLEVPDSRFADFASAGEAQLIADDACAHLLVLGEAAPDAWRSIDLRHHTVMTRVNDATGTCRLAREGVGQNVLGDPRVALAWLVNELSGLGIALEPGQFVSTGTCAAPLALLPGDAVSADYGLLGRLSLRFDAAG